MIRRSLIATFIALGLAAVPMSAANAFVIEEVANLLDPPNAPRFFPSLSILSTAAIGFNSNTLNEIRQSLFVLGPGLYDVVVLNGGIATVESRLIATPIPEPGKALLTGIGLALLTTRRRRRSDTRTS